MRCACLFTSSLVGKLSFLLRRRTPTCDTGHFYFLISKASSNTESMSMTMATLYKTFDDKFSNITMASLSSITGVNITKSNSILGLPSAGTPTFLFLVLSLYLLLVSLWLSFSKPKKVNRGQRESFALTLLVVFHNIMCLVINLYFCFGISLQAYKLNYSVWGNAYKEDEKEMAFIIYLVYLSKLYELLDTIIMLFKGNIRQVTFLHVYHHCSVSIYAWISVYHAPGGDAYFPAAINSGVHVLMYSYYLLSSMLRNKEEMRKKYLFWGRYLTQVQMIQFGVNMAHAYYCIKTDVPYPKFLAKTHFYYMISLLFLFYNFYLHKYTPKGSHGDMKKLR